MVTDKEELVPVVEAFQGGIAITEALKRSGLPPFRFYTLAVMAVSDGLLGDQTESARMADLLRSVKAAIEKL